MQEEIKSGLQAGNACYHSVQKLLSSSFLSKNLSIKVYIIIILFFLLYGCETWSHTLREERRLRVYENRVLRIMFVPKRARATRVWTKLHNEELTQYLSGDKIEKNEMGGACSVYGGEERRIQDFGGET